MDEYTNTKVTELSSIDYKIDNKVFIMNNKKAGLVVFYNYWCGYCQMVKPEFIKLTKNKKYNFYAVHGENPLNKKIFQHFLIYHKLDMYIKMVKLEIFLMVKEMLKVCYKH